MDGLGIERTEVDKIVKQGMKWKEKNTEKWHAYMNGIECVFEKKENNLFIITVYKNIGGKK